MAEKILIDFWRESEEVWVDGCGERLGALRGLELWTPKEGSTSKSGFGMLTG